MKRFFIWFVLLFVFICNSVQAENFYIDKYQVNMQVNKDKTVDITEDIYAYFTVASHGIYREIPIGPNEDIYNIKVNHQASIDKQPGKYVVKLGSSQILVKDLQHYQISYSHKLSNPNNEFYYNIIGTGWAVPILHVSFNVNMPEIFEPQKAGLSIGRYGTVGFNGGAVFNINGKTISGQTTTRKLNPGEGITLRVELPNNYFSIENDKTPNRVFALMIILTAISFIIWYLVGKDEHVTPVVSFYLPKGYNSAEIELIYSEKVTYKGLVSLIIWLANKGFLDIKEGENGHFSIEKVKILTEKDCGPLVYKFYNALIGTANVISDKTLSTSSTFYVECSKCINDFNNLREHVFEKNSTSMKLKCIMFLCLVGLIISEIYFLFGCSFEFLFISGAPMLLLFPIIAISVLITNFKRNPVFFTIWGLGFGGIPALMLFSYAQIQPFNMPYLIAGLIFIIITSVCFNKLPKRNKMANKLYGEVLGFKKFLETVEKPRVEALVKENPNYCFDVLPYLYIFGLTDKWIKKFEKFFQEPPEWYSGKHFNNIGRLMNNTAVLTQPSTANGGISSSSSGGGGGHSGGGSGGGGGGSW